MKKLVTCLAALAAFALLRATPVLASDSGPPAGTDLSVEVMATLDNDTLFPSFDTIDIIGTFTVTSAAEYILAGEPLNGAPVDNDVGWASRTAPSHTALIESNGDFGRQRDTGDQRVGAQRALPS